MAAEDLKNTKNQTSQPGTSSTDSIFDNLLAKTRAEKSSAPSDENKILTGVIEKEDQEKGKILGTMPGKKDLTLMKMMKRRRKINIGWTLLKVSVFLAIVSFGYFYYELTPTFTALDEYVGVNSVNERSAVWTKMVQAQADVNANNLLAAQIGIDRFVYLADLYFYYQDQVAKLSRTSSNSKQLAIYKQELEKVTEEILLKLEFIKGRLKKPFFPAIAFANPEEKTKFENEIRAQTTAKIDILGKAEEQSAVTFIDADAFSGAKALFVKQDVIGDFTTVNVEALQTATSGSENEETAGPNEFETTIQKLADSVSQVAKNDFSIVAKIRDQRIAWTDFIDYIEDVTKEVDPYYTKEKVRQIFYDSYGFNSTDGKITVSGTTRRLNNYNFTLIADLIDAFEKSPFFNDVVVGNFTKAKEEQYSTAPINLTFSIQSGEDTRDDWVTLQEYLSKYVYVDEGSYGAPADEEAPPSQPTPKPKAE